MSVEETISLADPVLGEKEKKALCAVIDSGWLTMGERVAAFERAFAELHRAPDAVAVNSCTAGLHLCLKALNIGPGDEVLVPSLTFVATVNAVLYTGATPVFVDIENILTPHISISDAQTKCTQKTKAIIVMHYGGYPVSLPAWRSFADAKGLKLVEDAAHAPAIDRVGCWGDAAAFSFFTNKNMCTAEGGMILARDSAVLRRIRQMRSHGMTSLTLDRYRGHAFSYDVTELGYNYRMDELRAAIGLAQLERLQEWNRYRRELSNLYRDMLRAQLPDVTVPFNPEQETAAHLMPVLLPERSNRDAIMSQLRINGIQSSIHYPPVHLFSYYLERFEKCDLKNTEMFFARELTLPLHPALSTTHIQRVVETLAYALAHP